MAMTVAEIPRDTDVVGRSVLGSGVDVQLSRSRAQSVLFRWTNTWTKKSESRESRGIQDQIVGNQIVVRWSLIRIFPYGLGLWRW